MFEYAGVHILRNPFHIDNTFDYFIPTDLRGSLSVGDFAVVPFGSSNKREIALVVSLKKYPDNSNVACKPIFSTCDKALSFSEEMLKLCLFMKEQTLCSIGEAVSAMMPSTALTDPHKIIKVSSAFEKKNSKGYRQRALKTYCRSHKKERQNKSGRAQVEIYRRGHNLFAGALRC